MGYFKKIFMVFLVGLVPFLLVQPTYSADPAWTELRPLGNVDAPWTSIATSPNGQVILAGGSSGRLVFSRDSGATWTDPFEGESDQYWSSVAVSSDGQKLAAAGFRVFISTNGGTTWTDARANGNQDNVWASMAMSADGRTLVAGVSSGRIFRSTNGGTSWSETRPAGNANGNWQTIAMNTSGDTVIAGNYSGRMYRSRDKGETWSEIRPAGDMDSSWNTVSIDGAGKIIVAGQDGGRVYVSSNTGDTWREVQPLGDLDHDWRTSGISMDGSKILIATSIGTTNNNRVFYSDNSGQSFREVQPAGNVDLDWYGVGISPDGHSQFAQVSGGRMYMRTFTYGEPEELVEDKEPWDCGVEKPFKTELFQIDTKGNTATLFFSPISNTNEFVISYSTNPSAEEHGAQVNLAREGVQSYSVSMLRPNTSYYFKVRGQHECRPGDWSEIVEAKTSASGVHSFFLHK